MRSKFVAILLCLAGLSTSCGQPVGQEEVSIERSYVSTVSPYEDQSPVVVPASKPVAIELRDPLGNVYLQSAIDSVPLQSIDGSFLPRDLPAWWDWDQRVRPGTETLSTTFIAGHAQASQAMVFNPLMTSVIGDDVVLQTESGVLTYRIESILLVPKQEIAHRDDIYAPHKGRLVLITCDVEGGNDTLNNRVVVAQLV